MTCGAEIEHSMRMSHASPSEEDRGRYAAIEPARLGHGGAEDVATLLDCGPETIRRGRRDRDRLPDELDGRVREEGAAPGGA